MFKRIVLACCVVLWVFWTGCPGMLDPQAAKDRDLGHVVEENLKTNVRLRDNIVSFTLVESGVYRAEATGLATAQEVGAFAHNIMVVLDERNNTLVRSGRSEFRIIGEQDDQEIFEVTIAAGGVPQVTLKGPFEGETWVPSR